MSRRRRKKTPQQFATLSEIVVGVGTLVVAAVAFAPEIAATLESLKGKP